MHESISYIIKTLGCVSESGSMSYLIEALGYVSVYESTSYLIGTVAVPVCMNLYLT